MKKFEKDITELLETPSTYPQLRHKMKRRGYNNSEEWLSQRLQDLIDRGAVERLSGNHRTSVRYINSLDKYIEDRVAKAKSILKGMTIDELIKFSNDQLGHYNDYRRIAGGYMMKKVVADAEIRRRAKEAA